MNQSEINWKSGEVVFWDIDGLDINKHIDSQSELIENDLKEDLVLARFGDVILLDLGWYPEFNLQGEFVLRVVNDADWENPILRFDFRDIAVFVQNLNQAIAVAEISSGVGI
jgi:hypothetical protein